MQECEIIQKNSVFLQHQLFHLITFKLTPMKKLFMTLFAAATLLAVGCTKNEDAESDQDSMNMMAGIWALDQMKFNNEVIEPGNYVNYVDEDFRADYLDLIAQYENNQIQFTFYANGDGEVFGEPFTYQIRPGGQMALTRNGVTIVAGDDTIHSDNYEIPYTVLSLTNQEALFEGFIFPMPHFRFPGGTITCHLTRIGDAPERPVIDNDTIQ